MPSKISRRALRPAAAIGLGAAVAGLLIGHYAWTSSSSTKPRATANRVAGPLQGGSRLHRGRNGSFTYTFPGGGSITFNGGSGSFNYNRPGGSSNLPGFGVPGGPGGGSSSSSGVASSITNKVDPGLVDINTVLFQGGQAAGTGMVVTSSGEVFTNNHVIAGASRISATDLGNGRTYVARIVGYDFHHDIAVLQLEGASNLKTVTLGDSSSLTKGQSVATIGNAGGVGGTPSASSGQITGLGQSITAQDEAAGTQEHLDNLVGLNGDLQPGDSGGPLVDRSGSVVGMDTAAGSTFVFEGGGSQGFAIPIDEVKSVTAQIVAGQASSSIHLGATGFLGVEIRPPSNGQGAYIAGIVHGTPAASSSLAQGDTITALDGQSVGSPADLTQLILAHHPSDQITVAYTTSSGAKHTANVTLTTGPAQ